jgi:hypothetical protein
MSHSLVVGTLVFAIARASVLPPQALMDLNADAVYATLLPRVWPSLSLILVADVTSFAPGQEDRLTPRAKAVVVSQLDPRLPKVSLEHWMSGLARPGTTVSWTYTKCPATYASDDPRHPTCVVARAESVSGRVAAVSVWLAEGRPETWGTPRIEEIFVDAGKDSLSVVRLSDLPSALRLSPAQWPTPDLRVDQGQVRCMPLAPIAGDAMTCHVVVYNDGGTPTHARLYVNPLIEGDDTCCLGGRWDGEVIANSSTTAQIRFQWPSRATVIWIRVELITRSGHGGHRSPIPERNRNNNAAAVRVSVPR